jgi:hypothetical protein
MNPNQPINLSSGFRRFSRRDGLTIVEVLTSIVVAMIGVFGVMVLIPFAVKQAQRGLDNDTAVIVANNAYSQFEAGGYRIPTNWAVFRGTTGAGDSIVTAYSPFKAADIVSTSASDVDRTNGDGFPDNVNGDGGISDDTYPVGDADPPMIFSIDPLGITENLRLNGNGNLDWAFAYSQATFPFNSANLGTTNYPDGNGNIHFVPQAFSGANPFNPSYPIDFRFPAANLGTASGNYMTTAVARNMFFGTDELSFGDSNIGLASDGGVIGPATAEMSAPERMFDLVTATDTTGNLVTVAGARPQTASNISWSAIVVPFKDDPTATAVGSTNRWSYQMYILVYKDRAVNRSNAVAIEDQMLTAQVNTSANTGLHSPLTTIQLEPSVGAVEGFINRDEWVMLINQVIPSASVPGGNATAEAGFDRQVAFYRVVSASDAVTGPASLTLDGPDFRFNNDSDPTTPPGAPGSLTNTHIVHLRNVVGVYERTFEPEFESIWTTR